MAKTANEITADIEYSVDATNTNEISEFNGKKYYAAIKDKNGKYLVKQEAPTIQSSESWCKAKIDRSSNETTPDGHTGALIKIQCDENTGTTDRNATIYVQYGNEHSKKCIKIKQLKPEIQTDRVVLSLPTALPVTIWGETRSELDWNVPAVPQDYYVTGNYSSSQIEQNDVGNVTLQNLGQTSVVPREDLNIKLLDKNSYQISVIAPPDSGDIDLGDKRVYKMLGVFVDVTGITLNKAVDFDIYIYISCATNYFSSSVYKNKYKDDTYGSSKNMIYGLTQTVYQKYFYAKNIQTAVYIPAGFTTARQIPLNDEQYIFSDVIDDEEKMSLYFPDYRKGEPHERTYKSQYIPCGFVSSFVDAEYDAQNIHNYCTEIDRASGVVAWYQSDEFSGGMYVGWGVKDDKVYEASDVLDIVEPFVEIH